MMKMPISRSAFPSATLAIALLVSACGGDNPDTLVTSAQDYLNRQDAPAAIIQLKNALKERPDFIKARLMLGQALVATGDAAGRGTGVGLVEEVHDALVARYRCARGGARGVWRR